MKYASPLVRSSNHEVYSYNWEPRASVLGAGNTPIDPHSSKIHDYLVSTVESFNTIASPQRHVTMHGLGLYLADDPVVSSGFGFHGSPQPNDFLLTQVTIPIKTRFLDYSQQGFREKFPDELAAIMAEEGCDLREGTTNDDWDLSPNLDGLMTAAQVIPACQTLRDGMIQSLKLSAMRYHWQVAFFQGCTARPAGAWIVFDRALINHYTSFVHAFDKQDGLNEQRLIIESLFRILSGGSASNPPEEPYKDAPWPELSAKQPSSDVNAWMKKNLLGCDPNPDLVP